MNIETSFTAMSDELWRERAIRSMVLFFSSLTRCAIGLNCWSSIRSRIVRETKAQRDAKRRALRQKIIDIVTEHQPLTCYQIAQHLGTEVSFISSACHGLYRNQFLKKGEFVDPDYASGRKARVKVCTWLIGDCADPLPKHALFSDETIRSRLPMKTSSG